MKKIANLLLIIFILLFFYLTRNTEVLCLSIGFSMFLLLCSLYSTTSVKEVIGSYHEKKCFYSRDRVFYCSLIIITLISILFSGISYFIGNVIEVKGLGLINIVMSISVMSYTILKTICEYLDILGYKKIGNNLLDIYKIVVLIIGIILSILLFKVFKLDTYLNIVILCFSFIFVFIVFLISVYFLIFRKKKKYKRSVKEKNISYIDDVKKVIFNNQVVTIYNIINSTYIYVSVIVLYYVFKNKYNYNNSVIDGFISNTYLYGLVFVYVVYYYIKKYLCVDYDNVKECFNKDINKVVKINLNLCILLIVLSIPLNNLIIGGGYNSLTGLILFMFFYTIYNYIVNINIKYSKNKISYIILFIGLIIKCIFEFPFINAFYRMGYTMVLGSVFASVMGIIISTIIGIVFIKRKFKINLHDNFNDILNIIYESIIYALVMVLFSLIIKVDKVGFVNNILVILFYIFITFLFQFIKRILSRK